MSKQLDRYTKPVLQNLKGLSARVSEKILFELGNELLNSDKIYLSGAGRSGLMVKTFAMRLMHMGLGANLVGSPVTPGATQGDFLLLASGSGETESVIAIARQAVKNDLEIGLITESPQSTMAKLADLVVEIEKIDHEIISEPLPPLGSLFEQSLFFLLEALVTYIMEEGEKNEKEMAERHANLE